MVPAQERFKAAQLLRSEIDFRLIPELELTVGDRVQTQTVALEQAPWRTATAAEYAQQDEFLARAQHLLGEMSNAANRMEDVRRQLQTLEERLAEMDGTELLSETCGDLAGRLEAWDAEIVARKTRNFQDIINFENKLLSQVVALVGSVDGTEPPVTQGARQRWADLEAEWAEHAARLEAFDDEIDAVNEMAREAGVGAIVLPAGGE